jgi:alpha-mannosidase
MDFRGKLSWAGPFSLVRAHGIGIIHPIITILLLVGSPVASLADAPALLWEIGVADGNNREFALAPNHSDKFRQDGVFFVGESDAARDWPYVQPGPNDAWAGNRDHTFVVAFGLREAPPAGDVKLKLKLLDAHAAGPPQVEFNLNGHSQTRKLAAGAGDDSINGQPAKGKPQEVEIVFPGSVLQAGENQLSIITHDGSWMLYDWLALEAPAGAVLVPAKSHTLIAEVGTVRALKEQNGQMFQPLRVTLRQVGGGGDATIHAEGASPLTLRLTNGLNQAELLLPRVATNTNAKVKIEVNGQLLAERSVTLKPVRPLTVYILPHSHTDIGYTEIQTDIEKKQVQNLLDGIAAARRTADYPEGARFVWNVEVAWAADLYLRRLNAQQRADFFEAVKRGQVVLNGMYLNELTGLCRPEELVRLFRGGTQLAGQTGRPIDSVMISDVPGYTWGTVTAMAHAGIRYFNTAPNYFDRIGTILREWENKPFWWVGPDGQSKVLVWIPFWGYAMSHRYGTFSPQLVEDFSDGLEQRHYPYDIAHVRWSGHGDNAVPDPAICDFVRDWNTSYAWPHFVISGVSEAFQAIEQKYGAQLPTVRGDWTPYWEDGAGSSALETALNRESSDRLTQAEALWTMIDPKSYPRAAFDDAWNSVLLYSEHTWGAHCSVWGPERQETKEQWEIKRGYALTAETQSRALLAQAANRRSGEPVYSTSTSSSLNPEVDVFNTTSWSRTDLVSLPKELSQGGDGVVDENYNQVPAQRLRSGELVFVAKDVTAFGTKRYAALPRPNQLRPAQSATASGRTLGNGRIQVQLHELTGAIMGLTAKGIRGNLADTSSGRGLNDYLYLIADDLKDLQRNGGVRIRVGEPGPLVASLIVESDAPGCRKLTREVRVVAGMDYVELINDVDKERAPRPASGDYRDRTAKESLNFAFEFNVPDGDVRLDLPLGVMRPETDQMPSACKNWFTVGRWADVANRDCGIQWVTLDAPLVQVGGITATLLNSQTNPDVWRKSVEPTRKIYSWAMNNHWGTNYRAYQEGLARFRFVLRPYRKSDPAENTRFATGFSQPLLPLPARGAKPGKSSLLRVSSEDVLITGLKPSDDGKALIVRLFGASGKNRSVGLDWGTLRPKSVTLTDTSEKPGVVVRGAVAVPGNGLVSLRAELGN